VLREIKRDAVITRLEVRGSCRLTSSFSGRGPRERTVHKKLCISGPSVILRNSRVISNDSLSTEKAIAAFIALGSDIFREDSRTLLIPEREERDIDRLERRRSVRSFPFFFSLSLSLSRHMGCLALWQYFAINSRIYSTGGDCENLRRHLYVLFLPTTALSFVSLGHDELSNRSYLPRKYILMRVIYQLAPRGTKR